MKHLPRRVAWRVAPRLMADRAVSWNQSVREREGVVADARRYAQEHGLVVTAGPFAGLRYPQGCEAEIDSLVAKLEGTYERDLHWVIAEASTWSPSLFVNIGTADGYYAVGFARMAGVPVHGFEPSPKARALCADLAQLNGGPVRLHAGATSRRVRSLPLRRALVLSDCEGAEASIFDSSLVAALASALVVIELHEFVRPGVTALLERRFRRTHRVEVIEGTAPERLRQDRGFWLVGRPLGAAPEGTAPGVGPSGAARRCGYGVRRRSDPATSSDVSCGTRSSREARRARGAEDGQALEQLRVLNLFRVFRAK